MSQDLYSGILKPYELWSYQLKLPSTLIFPRSQAITVQIENHINSNAALVIMATLL